LIPTYYQDGEDAFFMRKEFPVAARDHASSSSSRPFFERKVWQSGTESLRLPRMHHCPETSGVNNGSSKHPTGDPSAELLTGTM
jgi:hypothetical protein